MLSLALLLSLHHHPAGAQVGLQEFATGLYRPVSISHAGDARLFVVEQPGRILIVDSTGRVLAEPFLDISGRVLSTGNEQGLLGLAFHPAYSDNGYFFVNYTDSGGDTRISRFSVRPEDPDRADPTGEQSVLTVDQPFPNHNGGDIKFGPDGYLYIGLGDGGSAGDPQDNAQDLSQLLGKMLRLDVNGEEPYAIPESNPFAGDTTALDEIWASGLRNPWRFSFDRETGDLWIADVGQALIEEINWQPAGSPGGENYGWRCYEGSEVYNDDGCPQEEELTFPVHEYPHDPGGHCSVTGGFVYRGSRLPQLEGHYFFADYCSNTLWSLFEEEGEWILENHGNHPGNRITTFGEDHRGELYVAGRESGTVYRLDYSTATATNRVEDAASEIRVWPNPAGDLLWIESTQAGGLPLQATLHGPDGRMIMRTGPFTGRSSLDLESLPAGIYMLSVTEGDHRTVHRVVRK